MPVLELLHPVPSSEQRTCRLQAALWLMSSMLCEQRWFALPITKTNNHPVYIMITVMQVNA